MGWGPEAVLGAMERNRHAAVEAVVDSDPMSDALRDVLKREGVRGPGRRRRVEGHRVGSAAVANGGRER